MNKEKNLELNFSDAELRKMMFLLEVDEEVSADALRTSFRAKIIKHHTDKGGAEETAKDLTKAFRVLKGYIDNKFQLPTRGSNPSFTPSTSASSYTRSGCRPTYQAPQNSYTDGFEDFGDFKQEKNRRNRPRRQRNNNFEGFENWEQSEEENPSKFNKKSEEKPKFQRTKWMNKHTYDEQDYSNFKDPIDYGADAHFRRIRGGLALQADFRQSFIDAEYENITRDFNEEELYINPVYDSILQRIQNTEETLEAFTEKIKVFVNLDWATSDCAEQISIRKVRIIQSLSDNSSFYVILPEDRFDPELFSAGIHLDVKSHVDTKIKTSAIIDEVIDSERKLVLFFFERVRLLNLLALSQWVDISVNSSSFVYRSQLRSIEFIQRLNMDYIVFPSLNFAESFVEFDERREREIQLMDFNESDGFNLIQKQAIYSILTQTHNPYPFLLFGPPGTGKTVTLIETIRHIVLQSKNNRVLVCTPSRMAADNFAENLLNRNFFHPKYIFRMHSLSTTAVGRNTALDSISYLPKEGRMRYFGIPDRENLRMFRVIICTLSTSSYIISAGGFRGFFSHIIIDEAGQATEADTWIPIGGLVALNTSVILAGDPNQLGPVINLGIQRKCGYSYSMLKRLMFSEKYEQADDRSVVILKNTYRSHFKILRPCSYLFYDNMLRANEEDEVLYKLCEWDGLPTKGFPIIFHSSIGSEEIQGRASKSFYNETEMDIVLQYVEKIINETDTKPKDIGIISPYKNQVLKLRQSLAKYKNMTIDSVEGFQGSERDVIIISTVRTLRLGFLGCDLRLNTSISRAKSLLIVIGNENVLKEHLSWRKFIFYCQFHGGYLNSDGHKGTELISMD